MSSAPESSTSAADNITTEHQSMQEGADEAREKEGADRNVRFDVNVTEFIKAEEDDMDEFGETEESLRQKDSAGLPRELSSRKRLVRHMKTVPLPKRKSFALRMAVHSSKEEHQDYFHDFTEGLEVIKEAGEGYEGISSSDLFSAKQRSIHIPSLHECQRRLHNDYADAHRRRAAKPLHRSGNTVLNILAAFQLYILHSVGLETIIVVSNAVLVTWFFLHNAAEVSVKLDFSFLSFSVVFPLTFLVQSTFSRRDHALSRLADWRACVLSTALFTLSVEWADSNGNPTGGRLDLPKQFNAAVVEDCRTLIQLVYEYLSMPIVSHARHLVFQNKQISTQRVHALQNDITKQINDVLLDFFLHTEEMRKYGFPSGEASRHHQYHQYLQQRFEQLRYLKYYRTPQATRSFGRVYILVLPWLVGPYFAWVYEEGPGYFFTFCLAGFTFLVLLGLLNTQQGLEDPFLADNTSWTPGVDTVKLRFEMAVALQAIEQYYAEAELRKLWELTERKKGKQQSKVANILS